MTEDDTFKKLKGLSYDQCIEMYTVNYIKYRKNYPDCTIQSARDHIDTILKHYGWTCASMEKYGLQQ